MMEMARIASRVKQGPSASPALRSSSVALEPTARADERQHHAAGGRRTTDTSSVVSSVRPRTVATAPEVGVAGARGVPEQDPVLPSKTRCFNVHYAPRRWRGTYPRGTKPSARRGLVGPCDTGDRVSSGSAHDRTLDLGAFCRSVTVQLPPALVPAGSLVCEGASDATARSPPPGRSRLR